MVGGIAMASKNHSDYKKYDLEYFNRLNDSSYVGMYPELSLANLRQQSLDYKGRRDLFTGLTLAVYGINLIDAYATAHIRNSNRKHVPAKAAYYSTILPGLGQVYNRQWWKVPIFYGGLGVAAYYVIRNRSRYVSFRNAYINFNDPDYVFDSVVPTSLDRASILSIVDFYRTNLDLATLVTAGVYVLNIIDATVFSHLYSFNVDEDLSWRVQPYVLPMVDNRYQMTVGAGWRFSYRF